MARHRQINVDPYYRPRTGDDKFRFVGEELAASVDRRLICRCREQERWNVVTIGDKVRGGCLRKFLTRKKEHLGVLFALMML